MTDAPVVRGIDPLEPFESFYRREYRSVLGLAIVLSGSISAAEELTQEAFMAAFRQWERVGHLDRPGAWVRRVLANRSVSAYRRRRAEVKALLKIRHDPVAREVDLVSYQEVWRAVRRLPARQAQAVALTYFHGLSRSDVAEILQCSEETVKTHLDRARRKLSEWLT